jgi:hypothetical protein
VIHAVHGRREKVLRRWPCEHTVGRKGVERSIGAHLRVDGERGYHHIAIITLSGYIWKDFLKSNKRCKRDRCWLCLMKTKTRVITRSGGKRQTNLGLRHCSWRRHDLARLPLLLSLPGFVGLKTFGL